MSDSAPTMKYLERLEKIAQEISATIAKPIKLRAVLLQGSVAKSMADAYSDIELMCIWSNDPTAEERAALFASLEKHEIFSEELENDEWYSSFSFKQAKVDICHVSITLLQQTIDNVISARTASIASQTLLASIQDAKPLFGQETFKELTESFVNYPRMLAAKCIMVNSSFQEWSMRDALHERDDTIALHHLIDMTVLQMLRLLYAVNRVYLQSYNFKWIDQIDRLQLKPERFKERLRIVLSSTNEESIDDLTVLLGETLKIAGDKYPDLDLTHAVKALSYVRQKASD